MQVVLVGAGRMGSGLALNWLEAGHEVFYHDPGSAYAQSLKNSGASALDSLSQVTASVQGPRLIWLMLPSGEITSQTLSQLADLLEPGDLIIDGGNSFFEDTVDRASSLLVSDIHYVDVGTSGGILGRELGYCMMVGGDPHDVAQIGPLLESGSGPAKWAHLGGNGAGHYAKMVHNGIEYALMQAYAEGVEILATSAYRFDVPKIVDTWSSGSLIQSLLLDLVRDSVGEGDFSEFSEEVADLGTGRWATLQAIHQDVPAPVITAALQSRLYSRRADNLGWRMLSALRHNFGGHVANGTRRTPLPDDHGRR